jgi:hypothetical protein
MLGAVLALGLAGGAASAQAEAVKSLGKFGDWGAYVITEGGQKYCFMASEPKKQQGDYTVRGEVHLLVTHRPAQKVRDEISVVAGYPYKSDSAVALEIGKKTWNLFTRGERAWAWNAQDDGAITAALRKGSSVVVKGTSQRGTLTTDTYSLTGSSAAYEAISNACDVPVK